jgi:hypothetical protein
MAATFELKAGAAFAGGPFSVVGTMTLFKKISDHLTAAPHDRTARMSYRGQAHFGGTGPALKTCRNAGIGAMASLTIIPAPGNIMGSSGPPPGRSSGR